MRLMRAGEAACRRGIASTCACACAWRIVILQATGHDNVTSHRCMLFISKVVLILAKHRFAGPRQMSVHRGLRHRNPQLEQFSVNAGCSPQWVRLAHALN